MDKIKNIIFDIGGVLVENSETAIKNKFNLSNDKFENIKKTGYIIKPCLLGDKTIMECFSKLNTDNEMLKYIFDPNNYETTIPINYKLLDVIDELKFRGYKIYILSNLAKETFEYISNKIDYYNRFDGGVISYQVHLIKPDEKIYRILIEKYQLNIDETIFFDDNITNVNKGNSIGLKSFLYDDDINIFNIIESNTKKLIIKK